jgi:citrate lyase subunit beta/citryl-CoA lyase
LYLPGSNQRALEKAKELPADALIFDLEDSVAPDVKSKARERVCDAVASGGYGRRMLAIRINSKETPWHESDLAAAVAVAAGPAAIVLPKVNSAEDMHAIERAFENQGVREDLELWAMIETSAGVLRAQEIAEASARLTTMIMGTNDLLVDLRAEHTPDRAPLSQALSLCILAARSTGKDILDGVYNDITDANGFETECSQGRRLGFDGKTLIHPRQLAPCNRVFSPSKKDIEQARRVIEAFEKAQLEEKGVATLDGRLVENLHAKNARRVLGLAAAIDSLD